ncbi:MAG: hypothetical protein SNJ63_04565 [Sphingomonadaceae bacterium]
MYQAYQYQDVHAAAVRAQWQIEDVLPDGARLDFARPFMPEGLARTEALDFLSTDEKRVANQVRGHDYLSIFGLVEEFILPFVLDHVRPDLDVDDWRVRALLNFAGEEAKHIQLFRRFHGVFTRDFGTTCAVIGPGDAIRDFVLKHDPLAVGLVILMIEWMTQRHYLEGVRDDAGLDPLFQSLLRHHWMEEAGHARLDTLMVEALAEGRSAAAIEKAIDDAFAIAGFLDAGLKTQSRFNREAFEAHTGRILEDEERAIFEEQQHQAMRWTYIGSGLTHPKFRATVARIAPDGLARFDAAAPHFC